MSKCRIVKLSALFYQKHSQDKEILNKNRRPYLVLLLELDGARYAVPFRTNAFKPRAGAIKTCFYFSTSQRKQQSEKGKIPALDFVKSVVVDDEDIDCPASIDSNEFKELNSNLKKIKIDFANYISYYKQCVSNGVNLDKPEIKYSSLQYFKTKLGI